MIERIMMEADRIKRLTGKHASYVYLGRNDFDILRRSIAVIEFQYFDNGGERSKICGLDIFVVDADNHFNVG